MNSEGFEVHKSVSEKRNLTWIDEMDNFLVDRLMEQMHKGQKIGGVFTKTAYAIVAREIGENFELSCNSEHIKNRMKALKKNFYVAQEVLQSGSGFGFNESTQMIEATTEVWTTYTKAHPGASQLRYKPIRNYDKLSILLGKDRATGSLAAVVAALDRSNLQNYTEEQLFEEIAKIGGMSDVSHMKAYQALTGDVSAARAFLACPIDRRCLLITSSWQHPRQVGGTPSRHRRRAAWTGREVADHAGGWETTCSLTGLLVLLRQVRGEITREGIRKSGCSSSLKRAGESGDGKGVIISGCYGSNGRKGCNHKSSEGDSVTPGIHVCA
ncbi:hypothetical protein CK203_026910 [Vitis vinifera]|uniref:Myb/SANT-like domain-containing protein n=1 Tax=Vitis vinifera TaxID=29760 RepID=A0A438IP88_VITVI|nr:hypothetical protein CK203_026910 [Vitis vinifera]